MENSYRAPCFVLVGDHFPLAGLYFNSFLFSVPLGSVSEVPATSCAEIKASEGDNTPSGSYWLDTIKPGQSVMVPCNMLIEGIKILDSTTLLNR